MTVSKFY